MKMNAIKKTGIAIKNFIFRHKIISTIILICLLAGGYWWHASATNTSGVTRYVLAAVTTGTINSSVSGTGQVSALDQIDIKSEVSGKVVYINMQKDKEVKAGTLLAQIDSRDAQKAEQSAENDLANAQLSTTDVQGTATDALSASYDSGLNALTNTFKDLATIKANLDSVFEESSYSGSDSDMDYYLSFVKFYDGNPSGLNFWNNDAKKKYDAIQVNLSAIQQQGWLLGKNSPSSQIEKSINDTYLATGNFLDLIRQAFNLTQEYQNTLSAKSLTTPIKAATTTTQSTNLSDAVLSLSTDTSSLLSAKTDIIAKKQTVAKMGIDTQSQNLNIQQYENALADAKDTLAKYYIYAPMNGIISAADSTIKTGDTISSGTTLGSIITKQQIIEISLNEVDATKIKTGQKVTIIFDALPDITATGSVINIDTVGTVSQGVVSYGVKIALDIIDSQIKPGMSTSVNVITDIQQNVLTVPNSAVKTKNGTSYVLVLSQKQDLTSPAAAQGFTSVAAPIQKNVQIGIADNTNTEITSGLSAGDQVVVRTISKTAAAAANSAAGAGRTAIPGLTGGSGAVRFSGGAGGVRPGN